MIITGTSKPCPERLSKYRDAEEVFVASLIVEVHKENDYYTKALGKIKTQEKPGVQDSDLHDKTCLSCNKIIKGVSERRHYCDDKCKYQYRKRLDKEMKEAKNEGMWRVAQIKAMYFDGIPFDEIARRLGYKKGYYVKQQLSKHGISWEE